MEDPGNSRAVCQEQDGAIRPRQLSIQTQAAEEEHGRNRQREGPRGCLLEAEVVHFYNTRDVLRRCNGPNDPGDKVDCRPPPEVPVNVDSTIGSLGLTPTEEKQLVAFLKTLTDEPVPRAARRW